MLRRAPTAARPLGRARHAREQARPSLSGWTGMLALALAALAADQLTKAAVVHSLNMNEAVDILPGLSFWHVQNTGIAFGVFTGRLSFVVLLTVGAVLWMLAFFARSGARHPLIPVAIGLLLGGSVSNLWDRAYNNFVTDFIYIRLLPNFNLADSFIVTGVALLIFTLVRGEPGERSEGAPWDAS
jgi:signal peptidase II